MISFNSFVTCKIITEYEFRVHKVTSIHGGNEGNHTLLTVFEKAIKFVSKYGNSLLDNPCLEE